MATSDRTPTVRWDWHRLNSWNEKNALDILSVYLTSSPVAPLNKEYVEVETPLYTYIYFYEDERATRGDLAIYVGSVPTENLASFPDKLHASLARIAKGDLDMERMAMVINHDVRKHIEGDGNPLPFFIGFDHVQSDFVTVSAYVTMSAIPNHLRPHISTYVSSFFSLPVKCSNGERLSHEEVVNKLDDETVAYGAESGASNMFEELLRVSIKVEKDRYETAVRWLKDLFYGSEFDKERLQITLAKIQQSLPEMKRSGNTVLSAIASEQLYDETSTPRAGTVLKQAEFIPGLLQQLQSDPINFVPRDQRRQPGPFPVRNGREPIALRLEDIRNREGTTRELFAQQGFFLVHATTHIKYFEMGLGGLRLSLGAFDGKVVEALILGTAEQRQAVAAP
ncbi:hypothetical protein BJ322DRAFT_1165133 [Thelephora terrestris]|uniref:Uncharacterized protein n=1 Tax=Thelephora terrestris TaxID=56493 RepID=A0A9P6H609_9AGAM|nr:hypothetical protein BJ322DRAFT_1165133 [Thelephora terrestris]